MKSKHVISKSIIKFVAVLITIFATSVHSTDLEFLPVEKNLRVTFLGKTQSGEERHWIELRQLSYLSAKSGKMNPAIGYYMIYFAGAEYGPHILERINGHSPILKKVNQKIEVYYIAGAKTHIKQVWQLQGSTASKENEKNILWSERPKVK